MKKREEKKIMRFRAGEKLAANLEQSARKRGRPVSEEIRGRLAASFDDELDGLSLFGEGLSRVERLLEQIKAQNQIMPKMFEHFLRNYFVAHPSIAESGLAGADVEKAVAAAAERQRRFVEDFRRKLRTDDTDLMEEILMSFGAGEKNGGD